MKMGVNIWVTDADTGEKHPVCWGVNMIAHTIEDGRHVVTTTDGKHEVPIRETPAEVMALVAAKEREQARERIAAMALQGALANPERVGNGFCAPIDEAIKYADGLLDALAARGERS
jgi:hypothetical protein